MKIRTTFKWVLLLALCYVCLHINAQEKPRVIVLTDINNEPDHEESLVRFLVYSNEFDVEGIIATTSCWLRKNTREDLIRRQLNAYEKVRDNLQLHAPGYPTADDLRSKTCTGQQLFGMDSTGTGQSTPGSRLVADNIAKNSDRPLWILLWGGANTLAQALIDLQKHTPEKLDDMLKNVKVYSISDQEDAGPWIRREFPQLCYIVDPSNPDSRNYHAATWNGISGDRSSQNAVMYKLLQTN